MVGVSECVAKELLVDSSRGILLDEDQLPLEKGIAEEGIKLWMSKTSLDGIFLIGSDFFKIAHKVILNSKDIPSALLSFSEDLVSSSPNFTVGVPVELLESLNNLVLESIWGTVTDDMENSGSDSHVRIVNHLEDAVPEFWNVFLNFAWAKLRCSRQPNIVIWVDGVGENLVDILTLFNFGKYIPLGKGILSSFGLISFALRFHDWIVLLIIMKRAKCI